jgi:putative endonuclease
LLYPSWNNIKKEMNKSKTEIGKLAEDIAVQYLKDKNYIICERNWRFEKAEVDIIAKKNDLIVFVEVKYREGHGYGYPEDAVDHAKEERLMMAADQYLSEIMLEMNLRFDVIAISRNGDKNEIYHIEDAFYC